MILDGVNVDPQMLYPKDKLLELLKMGSGTDRDLAEFREKNMNSFGQELIWRYPIADGFNSGAFLIPVREGFLNIPFNEMTAEDYEILDLDEARLTTADELQYLFENWVEFSARLTVALREMIRAEKVVGSQQI